MSWRHVALASFALFIAFGVRWWWPSERPQAVLPALPDPRFDYTLENFTARFSNDAGELELLISGPKLVHDSAARTAILEQPRFLLQPLAGNWKGRADRAHFDRDEDVLSLEGNVRISQDAESVVTVLSAAQLQHDRRTRTISSAQTVEVQRLGTWLQAGGLMMKLDDNRIELSNDVHAKFQVAD